MRTLKRDMVSCLSEKDRELKKLRQIVSFWNGHHGNLDGCDYVDDQPMQRNLYDLVHGLARDDVYHRIEAGRSMDEDVQEWPKEVESQGRDKAIAPDFEQEENILRADPATRPILVDNIDIHEAEDDFDSRNTDARNFLKHPLVSHVHEVFGN